MIIKKIVFNRKFYKNLVSFDHDLILCATHCFIKQQENYEINVLSIFLKKNTLSTNVHVLDKNLCFINKNKFFGIAFNLM